MTRPSAERLRSSVSNHGETTKFPDFEQSLSSDHLATHPEESESPKTAFRAPSPRNLSNQTGNLHDDRWQHRRENHVVWGNGYVKGPPRGHGRQPSLSEAIRTIRTRKGSVSANAQEIAEALKAPVSVKLIVCMHQYLSYENRRLTLARYFVLYGT